MKKLLFIFVLISVLTLTSCKKNYTFTFNYLNESFTKEFSKNKDANLENLDIEHYIFEGWYTNSDFSGSAVTTVKATEDKSFFAKLTECYEITLNVEGKVTKVKVPYDEKVSYLGTPDVGERTFDGWYTSEDFAVNSYLSPNYIISSDLTLYAYITEKQLKVTFDTQGGNTIKTQTVFKNSKANKPLNPNKLFNSFEYWSTDKEGKQEFDFNTPITDNLTLYAQYSEVNYDGLIDEYLPDEIDSSIQLSDGTDELEFYWSSSDSNLFSGTGIYNPKRQDTEVEVYLEIYARGTTDSTTVSKKVKIKKYGLPELENGKVVIGYTSYWNYRTYTKEELQTVNVLDVSFGYVLDNGGVDVSSVASMMLRMVGEAHANGVYVCLSIQGYGEATAQFSNCAADVTLRKTLAQNMANVVDKYHLDGIDIDWEYPGSYSQRNLTDDRKNYTLLMKEIRSELDKLGSGYLLTAAIPAGAWGSDRFEMAALNEYFNYFNMMSYDLENPACGSHHCALYPSSTTSGTANGSSVDETFKKWTSLGVPANKICLGTAFYGKQIILNGTANNGLGVAKSTTISTKYETRTYAKLMDNQLKNIGSTTKYLFDESSKAPYLFRSGTKVFSTYENELSLVYKCQYALDNGLAGIIIWELGEDPTNTLIKAVAQGLDKHIDGEAYIIGGKLSLDKGATINVQTINEVRNSALANDLIYYSSDENIATVENGVLTALETGTVTIYATTADKSTVYGSMVLTIK